MASPRKKFRLTEEPKGSPKTDLKKKEKEAAEAFKEPVIRLFLEIQLCHQFQEKLNLNNQPQQARRPRPKIIHVQDNKDLEIKNSKVPDAKESKTVGTSKGSTIISERKLNSKFPKMEDRASVYLFVISTANNEEAMGSILEKIQTCGQPEPNISISNNTPTDPKDEESSSQTNEIKTIIPIYIGQTHDFKERFRKHDVVAQFMRNQEVRLWKDLHLFLILVPLPHPLAVALEVVLLNNFDFILNKQFNGDLRVLYEEEKKDRNDENIIFEEDDQGCIIVKEKGENGEWVERRRILESAAAVVNKDSKGKIVNVIIKKYDAVIDCCKAMNSVKTPSLVHLEANKEVELLRSEFSALSRELTKMTRKKIDSFKKCYDYS